MVISNNNNKKQKRYRVLSSLLVALGSQGVSAEVSRPDPAGEISKDLIQREQRLNSSNKSREKKRPSIEEDPAPVEDSGAGPVFLLNGIRFTRSAILTQQELTAIVQPWLGKEVSFADLQKILAGINRLYRQKNIYTAVAVFPEQNVENGMVVIRLVEGSIGEISLEGNEYTDDAYVREWINYDAQMESIDIAALERDILFYNRIHAQRLQAELRAGKSFGLTDVIINVPERSRNGLSLFVDNYGYQSTGEEQGSVLYQRQQLLRFGDTAKLYALGAKGLKSVSAFYDTPVGIDGWRLAANMQYTDSDLSEGDFSELGVKGNSLEFGLGASYLVYSHTNLWVSLTGGFTHAQSENTVASEALSDYQSDRYQVGAELNWLGEQWQLTGKQQYQYVNSKERLLGTSRKIGLYGAGLTFIYNFDSPFYAITSFDGQFTSEEGLPGSVSYSLGGPSALRGYRSGAISGDTGWYHLNELHYNGLAYKDYALDVFAFYDHGKVESVTAKQSPSSAGIGFSVTKNDSLALDVIVAQTLKNIVPDQDKGAIYGRLTWVVWD